MSGPPRTFADFVRVALEAAGQSTCRSKRGAVAFTGQEDGARELVAVGFNQQPTGPCDGSDRCKATCRRQAIHAEQALLLSGVDLALGGSVDVLHVKAGEAGELVASGPPDCIECAKLLFFAGVAAVWLYHEDGWRRYPAAEFLARSVAGEYRRLRRGRADRREGGE